MKLSTKQMFILLIALGILWLAAMRHAVTTITDAGEPAVKAQVAR
jgi:hypothetical protein